MDNELKPCPFCGGQARVTRGVRGIPFIFIKCRQCGAVISFDNDRCNYNPCEAVKYFNRRESI